MGLIVGYFKWQRNCLSVPIKSMRIFWPPLRDAIRAVVIGKWCHSQLYNLKNVEIGGQVFIFDAATVKCRSALTTLDSLKDLGQLLNEKAAIMGTIQTATNSWIRNNKEAQ
jgi:hypothetical protein